MQSRLEADVKIQMPMLPRALLFSRSLCGCDSQGRQRVAAGAALGLYEDIKEVNIVESSLGESVLLSSVSDTITDPKLRTQEQSH